MTSKRTAQVARGHLYVAKQRAASAASAGRNQTFKAQQRLLQDKARAARAVAKQAAEAAEAAKTAEAAQGQTEAPAPDAAPTTAATAAEPTKPE